MPKNAQSGEAGREVGISIVDCQRVVTFDLDTLDVVAHGIGHGFASARPQEADDTMMRIFQLPRMIANMNFLDRQLSGRELAAGGRCIQLVAGVWLS